MKLSEEAHAKSIVTEQLESAREETAQIKVAHANALNEVKRLHTQAEEDISQLVEKYKANEEFKSVENIAKV